MKPETARKRAGVLGAVVAAGLMAAAPAHEAFACGYHDPQQVARGFLNWIYPDSLHVLGAISMETGARRLPPPNFDPTAPDLFGKKYRATATALVQFGKMLDASVALEPPVSLILVEPMLWTRFERGPQGINTRVHVPGPQPGDLVLVSGEVVVSEIVARRMTFGEAHRRGLVRLYGSDHEIAQFLKVHEQVGAARQASAPAGPTNYTSAAHPAIDSARDARNEPGTMFQNGGKP